MMTLCCPRYMLHVQRSRISAACLERILTVLFLGLIILFLHHILGGARRSVSKPGVNIEPSERFVVDTPGCTIPYIDPFDKSISEIIQEVEPLICDAKPPLTYTEGRRLLINYTALHEHYNDHLDRCQYERIWRAGNNTSDNAYEYSSPVEFTKNVEDTAAEFVRVACFGKSGRMIYVNFHAMVYLKPDVEYKCNKRFKRYKRTMKTQDIFDFLIVGVDSVSRLNFIRHMPKVREYMLEALGAVEMEGYNKVADNTFVNLAPMFAGKFAEELPYDDRFHDQPFDKYDFIWKTASEFGYRTLFAEDAPTISIFNYDKEGFHNPPSDYYLRPFSLAVESHGSIWNSKHHCIGPKAETEVVLDYVYDFMDTLTAKPRFAFTFLTRLTHEGINDAGLADDIYLKFFTRLHEAGHLSNTVILFYSDHGMRFGRIRETYVGQLEERLPFVMLALPKYIQKKYPHLLTALTTNRNRLSSPFDIFNTLTSLLPFKSYMPANHPSDRGMNLLSEIPVGRTCEQAGIDSHWCTCHKQEAVDPESDIAQAAAIVVVDHINDMLSSHGLLCTTLSLDAVQDAQVILTNQNMRSRKSNVHDMLRDGSPENIAEYIEYVVTLRTEPGEALFEANVRVSQREKRLTVVGEISRINAYGDQSTCINYHKHKQFCFCS